VGASEPVFEFAARLFSGGFDMVILLTGVGTRALDKVLAARYPAGRLAQALREVTVVARGPKPAAVLREWNVPVTITVPKPNTWRELVRAVEKRPERRIAVQEYGRSNPELLGALRARGAEVTSVRVYQWDLPEDPGPLAEAARRLARGGFDVVLFTTAIQIVHLLRVSAGLGLEDEVRRALRRAVVVSIGPACTEMLEDSGVPPDLEASQGKMGILVLEAAGRAPGVLEEKRRLRELPDP
jgi:uroporphyrinogen-III synthase